MGSSWGAVLDRNGLRPARYYVTSDDRLILSSEAGTLDVDPAKILIAGSLGPGQMLIVDPREGRVIFDDEIKDDLANPSTLSRLDQRRDPHARLSYRQSGRTARGYPR